MQIVKICQNKYKSNYNHYQPLIQNNLKHVLILFTVKINIVSKYGSKMFLLAQQLPTIYNADSLCVEEVINKQHTNTTRN